MKMTANIETGENESFGWFARKSTSPGVVVGGMFIGSKICGRIVVGPVASSTIAFGNGRVEPRRMSPHPCDLVWGGIQLVTGSRVGYPPSLRLWFALVPTVAIGGFVVTGRWVACSMRVWSSIRVTVAGGRLLLGEGRLFIAATVDHIVLVTKLVGKVGVVGGMVTLRIVVDRVLLHLTEGAGR